MFLLLIIFATYHLVNGQCNECIIPTLVYNDLKCIPRYSSSNKCCPAEYDCSNIYNRPQGTCHFRGKYYQVGQSPNREDIASSCEHPLCSCRENGVISCIVASDSCAEYWVPEFVQPGCYLTYEQNRCCGVNQICPPFDKNASTCTVDGKVYREGEKFVHPRERCTKCICNKGFNGQFETPFCERLNCTTEIKWSKQINNYCAPAYLNWNDCCPRRWICPSASGIYFLPSTLAPVNAPKCKFGDKLMVIGEKYKYERQECECIIPPYLTCKL